MNKVTHFFWQCSGAHIDTLAQFPFDKSKYVGIGTAVFFTGLFAAISASYALHYVFDNLVIAITIGIIWGLFIFSLDRFIVSSMRKSATFGDELWKALPRMVLAVIISIVIATPLELRIFEKEINTELTLMDNEKLKALEASAKSRYEAEIGQIKSEIEKLNASLQLKAAQRDQLREIARREADGTGGSGIRNAGPIYQLKKKDADQADTELAVLKAETDLQLIEQNAKLLALSSQMNEALAEIKSEGVHSGLASRLEVMANITAKNSAIWMAQLFIMIMFIGIEMMPIMVKLLSPAGGYDYAVGTSEYEKKANYYANAAVMRKKTAESIQGLSKEEQTHVDKKLSLEYL